MATQPISQETQMVPNAGMMIPVEDPAMPTGLQNAKISIGALIELLSNDGLTSPIAVALVFAGPQSGGAAAPVFRALVASDLPVATEFAAGVVKPGNEFQIAADGTLTLADGTMSVDIATAAAAGLVKPGGALTIGADGTLNVNFGSTAGQVADGGALAVAAAAISGALTAAQGAAAANQAEVTRAQNAEGTNASAIANNALQIGLLSAGFNFKGAWNAATNSPALASGAGTKADTWIVGTAGTTTLDGNAAWVQGDLAVFNGTTWSRIPLGALYASSINPQITGSISLGGSKIGSSVVSQQLLLTNTFGWVTGYLGGDGSPVLPGAAATLGPLAISQPPGLPAGSLLVTNAFGWVQSNIGVPLPKAAAALVTTDALNCGLSLYPSAGVPDGAVYVVNAFNWVQANIGVGSAVVTSENAAAASGASALGQQDYDNYNAAAYGISLAIRDRKNTTAQRPTKAKNVILIYGESRPEAWQAAPALTLTADTDAVSYGQSVRSQHINGGTAGTAFTPVGDSGFHALISAVQNVNTGALETVANGAIKTGGFAAVSSIIFDYTAQTITIQAGATATMQAALNGGLTATPVGGGGQPALDLTQIFSAGMTVGFDGLSGAWVGLNTKSGFIVGSVTASQIVLDPTGFTITSALPLTAVSGVGVYATNNSANNVGEEPGVALAHSFRRQQLDKLTLDADPTRLPVVVNTCVGGQILAALSKGASPNIYNAQIDAVRQIYAAAGNSAAVIVILLHEGGNDSGSANATPGVTYSAEQIALFASMQADIAAITGQRPALCLFSQHSGGATPAALGIGNAQLALALAPPTPDTYGAYTEYPYPNYGQHVTPNTSRWYGEMTAKVAAKILLDGQGWKPLHMLAAVARGTQLLVTFHVPEPPLQVGAAATWYNGFTPTVFADLGVSVTDAAGANSIIGYQLVGDCAIEFTLGRAISGAVGTAFSVTVADPVLHAGGANIKDSDPTISHYRYVYNPYQGQFPAENIPALIGQPYDLSNWCWAGTLPGAVI